MSGNILGYTNKKTKLSTAIPSLGYTKRHLKRFISNLKKHHNTNISTMAIPVNILCLEQVNLIISVLKTSKQELPSAFRLFGQTK